MPSRRLAGLALAALLAPVTVATGQGLGGNVPFVDENATMADKLGERIPLDLEFRNAKAEKVTLREILPNDRPVVLNLGYFGCPGVCQAVTNDLATGLQTANLLPGDDLEVWTVSVDPREGAEMAAAKKESYLQFLGLEGVGRAAVAGRWRFLTSREDGVARALADAAGWRYAKNEHTGEFDHPPVVVMISPSGVVTRYLEIGSFTETNLRRAVIEASEGKVGTFLEQLFVSCMTWDEESQSYSLAMFAMRIGGVVTLLALGGMMAVLFWRESRKGQEGAAPASGPSPSPGRAEATSTA